MLNLYSIALLEAGSATKKLMKPAADVCMTWEWHLVRMQEALHLLTSDLFKCTSTWLNDTFSCTIKVQWASVHLPKWVREPFRWRFIQNSVLGFWTHANNIHLKCKFKWLVTFTEVGYFLCENYACIFKVAVQKALNIVNIELICTYK